MCVRHACMICHNTCVIGRSAGGPPNLIHVHFRISPGLKNRHDSHKSINEGDRGYCCGWLRVLVRIFPSISPPYLQRGLEAFVYSGRCAVLVPEVGTAVFHAVSG